MAFAYDGGVLLPTLNCVVCRQVLVLPHRPVPGGKLLEHYWPEGQAWLPWVCDRCGRFHLTGRREIR